MNIRRAARTALLGPLVVAGGVLVLTLGTANVFAASSPGASAAANTPQSSSKPHKHERVECSPAKVAENHGQCAVTFVDPATKGEHPVGQKVCFTVDPSNAGKVGTGAGSCAHVYLLTTRGRSLAKIMRDARGSTWGSRFCGATEQ